MTPLTQEDVRRIAVGYDHDHPGRSMSLRSEAYVDPLWHDAEQRGVFARTWQWLCHVEKLARPGSYVASTIAGMPIVAVRDRTGELRAFYNVCKHRAHELLKGCGETLTMTERGDAILTIGESWMKAGEFEEAILPLPEAADLAPDITAPINALCKVYEAKKDWEEVVRLKTRRLDVVSGDERSSLLLEIGDILANQMNDRTRAAKSYVAALDERPDDRKTLTKLMQLYSEEKDWAKLIEVVLKLASKVDDPKQKVKYLHTAAIVSAKQLQDYDQASKF